jgi:hypothetical protein
MPAGIGKMMKIKRQLRRLVNVNSQCWELHVLELARTIDAFSYTLHESVGAEKINTFDEEKL